MVLGCIEPWLSKQNAQQNGDEIVELLEQLQRSKAGKLMSGLEVCTYSSASGRLGDNAC